MKTKFFSTVYHKNYICGFYTLADLKKFPKELYAA